MRLQRLHDADDAIPANGAPPSSRPWSGINPRPWGWEIYRDGKPLPARLHESGFRTEHTATLAGKVALRDFLEGLALEESKADW
jgi:hypothetical protein